MYSSGNIDIRNCVPLIESPCIVQDILKLCTPSMWKLVRIWLKFTFNSGAVLQAVVKNEICAPLGIEFRVLLSSCYTEWPGKDLSLFYVVYLWPVKIFHHCPLLTLRSIQSSFSIVTRPKPDRSGVRIPIAVRDFCLVQNFQSLSGPKLPRIRRISGKFPRVKAAGTWLQTQTSVVVKNEWSWTSTISVGLRCVEKHDPILYFT